MKKAIIFDTETTGLLKPSTTPLDEQPYIIEIGACLISTDGIHLEMSELIQPPIPISAEITKITGITNEQLVGKPAFSSVVEKLELAFSEASVLICHNAPFDTGMLRNELARIYDPEIFPWPKETICTVQEYKPLFGYRPRLDELYHAIVGRKMEQTHRALDDVKMLYEVLLNDEELMDEIL